MLSLAQYVQGMQDADEEGALEAELAQAKQTIVELDKELNTTYEESGVLRQALENALKAEEGWRINAEMILAE